MGKIKTFFENNFSTFILYKRFFLNPFKVIPPFLRFFSDYFFNTNKGFPLNINLSITSRCNSPCVMCYDKNYLNKSHDELSYKEIISFINDIAQYKPLIFLTGGEPFLHHNIIDILQYIKKRKLHCGICTNGTLLDKSIIKSLVDFDIDNIIFSIHGTEENHDNITGVKGSYKKAIHNLKQFCELKKNTHVMVNCIILPENIGSIEKLILICEKIGVNSVRLEHLSFLTNEEIDNHYKLWHRYFPNFPISLHQYVENDNISFLSRKIKLIKNKQFKVPVLFKPSLDDSEIDEWYIQQFRFRRRCLFLWLGVFITPKGDVYPCQTLGFKLGNIREKPLKEIFNSHKAIKLRSLIKKELMPGCSRCCKL